MKEIFVISKIFINPIVDIGSSEVISYIQTGWVATESEAKKIVSDSKLYTATDHPAIIHPIREFTYKKLSKVE